MSYYAGDYQLDVFDTYSFLIISPCAFVTSAILIWAQLANRQLMRQPGDLIFMVSLSELFLSGHYFITGLMTTYISKTFSEHSVFCRTNSWISNIFTVMEYLYNICLISHIYFTMRSAIQKSFVPKKLYHVFNILVTFVINFYFWYEDKLGKTPYGICSIRYGQFKKGQSEGIFKDIWASALSLVVGVTLGVMVLFYTSRRLPNFGKELNELKRDFLNYYNTYIRALIMIWLTLFIASIAQVIGVDQHFQLEENQDWRGAIFRIGRIGNTAKALMPLLLFFIRIQDPLIRKKIWSPFFGKKKDDKKNMNRSITMSSPSRMSTLGADHKGLDESRLTEDFGNFAAMVEDDQDDLMWMNLLPSKIKESYTRTFLACIQTKFVDQLTLKKDIVCSTKEDTQDVIMYSIDGHALMKTLDSSRSIIDCKFTVYCPALFREIIKSHYRPLDLLNSLDIHENAEKIKKAGESGGGASGELFMFSHDGKLILKTANHEEVEIFKKIMLSYKDHLKTHPKSQIGKIIGLFDFNFEGSGKSIKLILMENLFTLNSECIMRKYDMKGSKHSRKVLKNYDGIDCYTLVDNIMKDLDFLHIEVELKLTKTQIDEVIRSIEADVEFFTQHKIIDYSIILAVVSI